MSGRERLYFTCVITRGHFQKRESEICALMWWEMRPLSVPLKGLCTRLCNGKKRGNGAFSGMHLKNCKCKQIFHHPQTLDPRCKANYFTHLLRSGSVPGRAGRNMFWMPEETLAHLHTVTPPIPLSNHNCKIITLIKNILQSCDSYHSGITHKSVINPFIQICSWPAA